MFRGLFGSVPLRCSIMLPEGGILGVVDAVRSRLLKKNRHFFLQGSRFRKDRRSRVVRQVEAKGCRVGEHREQIKKVHNSMRTYLVGRDGTQPSRQF